MKLKPKLYIGTSGWHYNHWMGLFYPADVTGYNELKFYSEHFDSVENNSSFYRSSKESTYKTWSRMTPEHFKFSLKLNKEITHVARLELTNKVKEKITYILHSLQVLENKLGAIVIQLPASFKVDLEKLDTFLKYFTSAIQTYTYKPDLAIEFRNTHWFSEEVYALLRTYNVALVAAQSSRYPGAKELTANCAYIRLHGPEKLFASKYSIEQLREWTVYIKKALKKGTVYVYFNNDFHGYAIDNAKELKELL